MFVLSPGCIPALVELIKREGADEAGRQAARALGSLAAGSAMRCRVVVAAGGTAALAGLLQRAPETSAAAATAAWALHVLAAGSGQAAADIAALPTRSVSPRQHLSVAYCLSSVSCRRALHAAEASSQAFLGGMSTAQAFVARCAPL